MQLTLPGTAIEVSAYRKGTAEKVLSNIFAGGGVVLSQIATMTALEPYSVQNWVKRGFVSKPQHRLYSKRQFARIVMINMLRQTLQIEQIIALFTYINGVLSDESDDRIDDAQLYNLFVDLLAMAQDTQLSEADIVRNCSLVTQGMEEPIAGTRMRVEKVLLILYYAWYSAQAKRKTDAFIRGIE